MNYYIKKGIVLIILLFGMLQLQAQDTTLNFTLESDVVNIAGYDTALKSTIIKSDGNIILTQYSSDAKNETKFNIINSSGDWNQDTSIGSIIYSMAIDDFQCNLTLLGQESGISVILNLRTPNLQYDEYKFIIRDITYNKKP